MSGFIKAWFLGKHEAWARWQKALLNELKSFHLSPETKEDIIQDVSTNIVDKEKMFEAREFETGQFLNYGKTSVRRAAMKNGKNSEKTSHLGEGDVLVQASPEDDEEDPRQAAIDDWVKNKPEYKQISDCAKAGQSHKQIAETMGIGVRTVSRRLDEIRLGVDAILQRGR